MFKLTLEELKLIEKDLSSIVCPVCGKSDPVTISMPRDDVFILGGHCCPERYKLITEAFVRTRDLFIEKHKRDFMSM